MNHTFTAIVMLIAVKIPSKELTAARIWLSPPLHETRR